MTPKIRKPEVILKNVDSNNLLKQPIMQVTAADDAPIICDRHSTEKGPKRRKLFKHADLELDKDDDSCCKKFNGSSCGYHETKNEAMDSKLKSENAVVILNKDEIGINNSGKNIYTSPDIKSPDKIWSVASRTESPKGEIKLCINRKKKPLNTGPSVTGMESPAIRVSRRMANEVGISAEQLQQLMTCSPSPQKRKANKIPITKRAINSNVLHTVEKENISESNFQNQETLQDSKCGNSVVCVPKLKLKDEDHDVFAEEPSNILKDGTNKELNKTRRRWKMHMPGNNKRLSPPKNIPEVSDSVTSSNSKEGSIKSSKFSPLSSTSLYNLTTSPLRYDAKNLNPLPRKRRKAHKKLYVD